MIQKWQKNITSRVNTAEEVTRVNDIKIETLTEQERKLIQIIRELGYGELNITVKAGKRNSQIHHCPRHGGAD